MQMQGTLCSMFLGTLFSSFLLTYECRKLDGFPFPVYTTEFCPRNKTEWEARSAAFNCNKDSSYACLPNENITGLLEFCYPQQVIPIQEDLCLFLTKKGSNLGYINCTGFENGCPSNPYFASAVYNLQLRGIQKGEMEVILSGFLHFLEHLSYVQYSSFQLSSTEGKEATADNKLMMKKIKKLTSCCRTQTRKTTGLSRVMKNRFFTNGKKTTFFLFQQKQLMK
ncbi:uncharacterized protein LOC111133220 isoform X4 [Crassostrea virginica]